MRTSLGQYNPVFFKHVSGLRHGELLLNMLAAKKSFNEKNIPYPNFDILFIINLSNNVFA